MDNQKKYIRFIDSEYNTLFHVPDGGSVRVTSGYDGSVRGYLCKYIDETHAEIGNNVYHICQFAELMERNKNKYEPVQEIGDLDFYQKRYFDRENLGDDGAPLPYYLLVERNELVTTENGNKVEAKVGYAYCPKPSSSEKTFCISAIPVHGYELLSLAGGKRFALRIEDLCDDYAVCAKVNKIVHAIKEEQKNKVPSLDSTIKACREQASSSVKSDKLIDNRIDL